MRVTLIHTLSSFSAINFDILDRCNLRCYFSSSTNVTVDATVPATAILEQSDIFIATLMVLQVAIVFSVSTVLSARGIIAC